MHYLSKKNLLEIGIDWLQVCEVVNKATVALHHNDFSQPLKPYLRYKDLTNRIIAMPAFIGGDFAVAGIKWIASFPGNLHKNIPRAHSVVILNEESTGKPLSVINTPLLSGIRTAGVTGAVIQKYFSELPPAGKKKVRDHWAGTHRKTAP